MADLPLAGKVALITGAPRNLGRSTAEALAEDGAAVAVHYNSAGAKSEAERTAAAIKELGSEAVTYQADLSKVSNIEQLLEAVVQRFGRVDILVNTVGKVLKKPLVEVTEAEYDDLFAINAKAAFFLMRETAKRIVDDGRIINIATSLVGATTGLYSVYAGSKAPLEHFGRALAKELGPRGITVNTVAPGPLNTSFFYPAESDATTEYFKTMSVGGRLGEVEDVVPLIRFLASPAANWITAQTLFVNGGFLAR